ncbi:MAG TPA: VanZ family protein, partial [Pirellulales bacterium]
AAMRQAAFTWCAGVLLCVTAFGLLDEATQPFTGRDFDWFDWLADSVGALGGMICYEVVRRRWNRLPAATGK